MGVCWLGFGLIGWLWLVTCVFVWLGLFGEFFCFICDLLGCSLLVVDV